MLGFWLRLSDECFPVNSLLSDRLNIPKFIIIIIHFILSNMDLWAGVFHQKQERRRQKHNKDHREIIINGQVFSAQF